MKVAVEGCAHGELEKIYDTIAYLEQRDNVKLDLLICCGDFQSTRNIEDLRCMAVPLKYQDMGTFYKYYSGEKKAPILTLFIGGNHEASNYLSELAYGGWVAPNIYYLGYAGVVQVGGIRIAGLSGIYKGRDYKRGHFEKAPFSENSKRSVYHVRNLEVFRLKQLSQQVDIVLSHDWPRGVYHHGNINELLKRKSFFKDEIERNELGSQAAEELLQHLKPSYWFSAHLHCKFAAVVPHISQTEGEADRDTKFLALDKCLPKRHFLQVLDIPHDESKSLELEYDLEWLAILYLTNHLLSVKDTPNYMPGPGCDGRWIFTPTSEEKDFVLKKFSGDLKVPENFSTTVTPFQPSVNLNKHHEPAKAQLNPQTMAFCDRLGIDDPIALLLKNSSFLSDADCSISASFDESQNVSSVGLTPCSTPGNELPDANSKFASPKTPTSRLSGLVLPPPQITHEREIEPCEDNPIIESRTPSEFEPFVGHPAVESSTPSEFEPSIDNPIVECRAPSVVDKCDKVSESDSLNKQELPQAKKFKRRNQSLYMPTDDD